MDSGDLKAEDGAQFVNQLLAVAEEPRPEYRVHLVLTLRSEYLGRCDEFQGLPEVLNRAQYLVPRLTPEEMRKAVENPAALEGVGIEDRLLSQLLSDASTGNDALPRLQHLLMRLWHSRSSGDAMTLADYNQPEIGGLQSALDLHATRIFDSCTQRQKEIARRLFQALTRYEEGAHDARRPTRMSQMPGLTGAAAKEVQEVIKRFREENFLALLPAGPDDDPEIDITHESLIRHWQLLDGWVREEARAAEIYRGLAKAASSRQDPIWTDVELQEALRWRDEFGPNEIWAGRYSTDGLKGALRLLERLEKQWKDSEKRKQRQFRIVAGLALLFLVLAAAAFYEWQRATSAERAVSAIRLAAHRAGESERLIRGGMEPLHAKLLAAIDALRAVGSADMDEEVRKAAQLLALPTVLLKHDAVVQSVAFGPEDRFVVTLPEGNKALLWDIAKGTVVQSYVHTGRVNGFTLSENRDLIVTVGSDGDAIVWHTLAGGKPVVLLHHDEAVNAAAFSPDGKTVATACDDGKVRLWDLTSGRALATAQHDGPVNMVAFSPDGSLVASAGDDNGAWVWRAPGLGRVAQLGMAELVTSLVFTTDVFGLATGNAKLRPRLVLTADYAGEVGIWGVPVNGFRWTLLARTQIGAWHLAVTGNSSSEPPLWPLRTTRFGQMASMEREQKLDLGQFGGISDNGIRSLVLGEIGPLAVSRGKIARLFATGTSDRYQESIRLSHPDMLTWAAISEAGSEFLTAGGRSVQVWEPPPQLRRGADIGAVSEDGFWAARVTDGAVQLIDLRAGREGTMSVTSKLVPPEGLAFSQDGKFLTELHPDRVVVLDAVAGTQRELKPSRGESVTYARIAAGTLLLAGPQEISVWDPDTSEERWRATPGVAIRGARLSPDGRHIVAWTGDGQLYLYANDEGGSTKGKPKRFDAVGDVQFSPDGARLAVCGDSGGVSLVEANTGELEVTLKTDANCQALAFDLTGRLLSIGDGAGISVWDAARRQKRA